MCCAYPLFSHTIHCYLNFSNRLAASYVELELVDSKGSVAKLKTVPARRTLDPLYQAHIFFTENYVGCALLVSFAYNS